MLSVADDHIFNVLVARINKRAAHRLGSGDLRARVAELEYIAVFEHYDVLRLDNSQRRRPVPVAVKLPMLAMNRHQKLWPRSLDQDLQVFLAAVARNMDTGNAGVDDLGPTLVTMRDQ